MLPFLPLTLLTVVLDALAVAEARAAVVDLQLGAPQGAQSLSRRDDGITQVMPNADRRCVCSSYLSYVFAAFF